MAERLECHPLAEFFPAMAPEEFEELKASIRARGQLTPIVLHPDGRILDGRHRARACYELGLTPVTAEFPDEGMSPLEFVIASNLVRRHLSSSQRAVLALAILPHLEEEAASRMRNPTQTFAEGESAEQAARLVGTNRQYVRDVKHIRAAAPELLPKITAGEMTVPEAKTAIRREQRARSLTEISARNAALPVSERKYGVLYVDPPWRYEHCASESRAIENHYPTLTYEELVEMDTGALCLDDAVLFLWATAPKLSEALSVMNSWGFSYRTSAVWNKERVGMGYYFRIQHELLLVGVRGEPGTPEPSARPASIISESRGEHSAKPERVYEIIEAMYPAAPKLELFARGEARTGWDTWGNQSR